MFYTPAERLIFTSPLGAFDPITLQRKLVIASGGALNNWLAVWGDSKAPEIAVATAEESLVGAARVAFGVKPLTADGGTTDREVLDTLCAFLRWAEGKDLRGSSPR